MKKIIIVIGLFVFFSFNASAQGGFRLGVKGGLNLEEIEVTTTAADKVENTSVGIQKIEGCYYNVMGFPVSRFIHEIQTMQ